MKSRILSTELRSQMIENRLNSFQSVSPVYKLNLIQVTYKYNDQVHYLIRENRKEILCTTLYNRALVVFRFRLEQFIANQLNTLF